MTAEIRSENPVSIIPDMGIHYNIPDTVYHRCWDALNNSRLSDMNRSPAYCKWGMDHPREETDALEFGKAVHCAILEPDRFETAYTLDPTDEDGGYRKGWRNTKAYKEAKAALVENGHSVVKQDTFDACRTIRDRIYNTPSAAQELLNSMTHSEVSFVADDPETGLRCKVRPDIIIDGGGLAGDVKTTRDASRWAFERSIYSYGYHRGKAHYLDTMNAVGWSEWDQYLFLVIENTPPYEFAVYDLDPAATDKGRRENTKLKALYRHCLELDEWPGYDTAIQSVGLPNYAYYQEEEEDE